MMRWLLVLSLVAAACSASKKLDFTYHTLLTSGQKVGKTVFAGSLTHDGKPIYATSFVVSNCCISLPIVNRHHGRNTN